MGAGGGGARGGSAKSSGGNPSGGLPETRAKAPRVERLRRLEDKAYNAASRASQKVRNLEQGFRSARRSGDTGKADSIRKKLESARKNEFRTTQRAQRLTRERSSEE